jgi:hypothetical protein
MKVTLKDSKMFIEIDLQKPTLSKSRKSLVVASTNGNIVTEVKIDGKSVILGLNAYIPKG